jgi:hypothetical protein
MKALWPLLALFWFSCVSAAAAELPDAPQPGVHAGVRPEVYSGPRSGLESLVTPEHVWLTIDLGARIGDYTSTQQALRNGGHEAELPLWLVRNKPVMLGYELSYVATEYRTVRWLDGHRHHRIAMLLPAIDAAVVGATDWHNYTVTGNRAGQPPRVLGPYSTSPLQQPTSRVLHSSSSLP